MPTGAAATVPRRPRIDWTAPTDPWLPRYSFMKSTLFIVALLIAPAVFAQSTFPGLKSVLTEAEWKRARLDRLTPDELGVIDAALIRHYRRSLETVTPAIAEQVESGK